MPLRRACKHRTDLARKQHMASSTGVCYTAFCRPARWPDNRSSLPHVPMRFLALRRSNTALLLLLALTASGGCSQQTGSSPVEPSLDASDSVDASDAETIESDADDTADDTAERPDDPALREWCGPAWAEVEERIDGVLRELTLEQKVSLMHGSVPLPLNGVWETTAIPEFQIPGFRMLDGPRGVSRFATGESTTFPVAMARGATWNPDLERQVGQMIAAEARLQGADVLLAPTVNVLRHPRWGRAQETYGEDPFHLGTMGSAFVQGAQIHTMAVVKHLAANSIENTRLRVNVQVDERALQEIYLPAFRQIVQQAGVAGVMSAYNRVNGEWASQNYPLLTETLREDWGFQGFVVSDFVWGTHDTIPAISAGLDVEMPTDVIYGEALVDAVNAGDVDLALVDAAVRRILRTQWCFAERIIAPTISETETEEALQLAREAAVQSMVLLENRNQALPLVRDSALSMAVVGSLADVSSTGDRGSSDVRSTVLTTPLQGLRDAAGASTVTHVPGDLADEASQSVLRDADAVVVVVGYTEDEEGEGQVAAGDRVQLALPADDIATIRSAAALNDRVIVVVIGGSSFTMDGWQNEVEAIVMAWYPGGMGGPALADLLFGERNFSGRLPISFAAADEDLPEFDNVSADVEYGYFHGYRHLQRNEVTPLYPFGYGLSYTTFAHQAPDARYDAATETLTVDVTVQNMGEVAGIETVQVYVASPGQVVERAARDLRGFTQVELQPGESERVSVSIPRASLAWFDVDSGTWRHEAGVYGVEVRASVEASGLRAEVEIP